MSNTNPMKSIGVNAIRNFEYVTFIVLLIILILFIVYFYRLLNKRDYNCKNIKVHTDLLKEQNNGHINYANLNTVDSNGLTYLQIDGSGGVIYDLQVRDFYIKTAYNCCCSGKFKNDYVDLCSLDVVNAYGVRALDFQIYSKDEEPIVAASASTSHNYKETYNYLKLSDVLYHVNNLFIVNNQYGMGDDPLFLIFRMHTIKFDIYNKMAEILNNVFGIDKFYSKINRMSNNTTTIPSFAEVPMKDIEKKVIIILIHDEPNNTNVTNSQLGSYVDIFGNSMKLYRYDDLKDSTYGTYIQQYTKNNLCYVMPNLEASSVNNDYIMPLTYGIQFIGMNYQSADSLLKSYNNFFIDEYGFDGAANSSHVPYIKKPNQLLAEI